MRDLRRWVQALPREADPTLKILCFPFAGSGTAAYRPWVRWLPQHIQVCPVLLPGREMRIREKPITRIEPLVRELIDVVTDFLDRPFALFGHSLGALLAFEFARALRGKGLAPDRLFVSAHRAPRLKSPLRPIHRAPDAVFFDEIRRLEGTPEEILENRELMDMVAPALRADFEMAETYVYKSEPPLEVPISAFGGIGDRLTTEDKLQPWAQETTADFKLRMLPGAHFFLQENPKELLAAIVADLE